MGEKNKRRMYIAYYRRMPTPDLLGKYHTALLTTPKKPDSMSTMKECWLYHVVDRVAPEDDEAIGHWIFEARKIFARTTKLQGLLLLGKIPESVSDEDIRRILDSVPRKATVAEDPYWRCCHWVYDAITHLVSNQIVLNIPITPAAVWDNGYMFLEGFTDIATGDAIPCCNTQGKSLPSEIGPMNFTT